MGLWRVIRLGNRLLSRAGVCVVGLITMLNLGPAAAMAATMLLSLAVYAAAFGWRFALGFVLLLLVHEIGHLIAARVVGLRSSIPMFVPFVGAVISLRQAPKNAKMEANIAIGGPATGTLSALVCLLFYLWTDSVLMLVLAYTACILNLFNLIPCTPLDGGRITAAISSHLWWVGTIATGILFFYTNNFFLFIIFLFSLFRLWQGDSGEESEHYYQLSLGQRIKVALWYFGLLAILGLVTLYLMSLLP
ncbi:MAG: site-2 protease family protein [Negativicutes bacterium]|nr:site-2 protease family protein [Negativicutes bacterium]